MAEASVAAMPAKPDTALPAGEEWQFISFGTGGQWLRVPTQNSTSPVTPPPVTRPPVTAMPPKPTTPLPDNEEWQFIGNQWLRVPKTNSTPPVTQSPVTPPVYAPPIIEDLFPAPVAPSPPDISQPSRPAGPNPLIAALRANSPAPARSAEGPSELNYPWMQNTVVPSAPAPAAPDPKLDPKRDPKPDPKLDPKPDPEPERELQPGDKLPDDEKWEYIDYGGEFGGQWLRVPR